MAGFEIRKFEIPITTTGNGFEKTLPRFGAHAHMIGSFSKAPCQKSRYSLGQLVGNQLSAEFQVWNEGSASNRGTGVKPQFHKIVSIAEHLTMAWLRMESTPRKGVQENKCWQNDPQKAWKL